MSGAAPDDSLSALQREIVALIAALERREPDPALLERVAERVRARAQELGSAAGDAGREARARGLQAVALDLARRAATCAETDLGRVRAARAKLRGAGRSARRRTGSGGGCDVSG